MDTPVLYVIAGPNGIGKTTSTFDLVPSGIPIINSDEIARVSKISESSTANMQEYSNREALRLMDVYLQEKKSFAIETNLADNDTWKSLLEIQKSGYQLDVIFLSTDNIDTLNARIQERVLRGEHYVRPDIVSERYINGLKLLDFYFKHPNQLKLIDNSEKVTLVAKIENGQVLQQNEQLPNWVVLHLGRHFAPPQKQEQSMRDMNNAEEVRKAYLKKKQSSEESQQNIKGKKPRL